LVPTRRGDPREALHFVCLQQDLGRDCALAVVRTFDLPAAVDRYGERAYRYAHLQAGMDAARLELAAMRLGHGASGIGGFFDDAVTELLGLGPRHAVAYLTTIGRPAEPSGT
jgi:nitroreductase